MKKVYFQRWVAGIQGGGAGITVNLNLKKPLDKAISLTKLQLKVYETTTIEKIDDLHYIARINTHTNDLKLDEDPKKEYGNEIPPKSDVNLKEGQVKIFFTKMVNQAFNSLKMFKKKKCWLIHQCDHKTKKKNKRINYFCGQIMQHYLEYLQKSF
ncbi:MAG: hypothetical protein HC854_11045 [Flavobacterium sp.]|nr:hypothetical protein [Flavobacterium sp.]